MDKLREIDLEELNYMVQCIGGGIVFLSGVVALMYFGLAMGY